MTTQIVESCKRAVSSDTILSFKHLPVELLIEILLKLPVKSLIKLTCVCKTWYSVVNDSHFITTHLNQSTLNGDNHLVHLPTSPSGKRWCSMLSMDTLDGLSIHEIPFNPEFDTFRIAGSRNGLLCLTDYRFQHYGHTLYLWNPSTQKVNILRDSCFSRKPDTFVVLGFGFHHQANDYKVVRILYDFNLYFNGGKGPEAEVFTLSTNSWRKIEADGIDFPDEQSMSVFVNGAVHGKASRGSPERIIEYIGTSRAGMLIASKHMIWIV
ncbi:hypothetical protein RJ640_020370 [Escallonia rubra]|uniref:F-box domain-containing protein n=1 Tax=Escallonia rubra TaxID=112253 RepID=A0AA88R2G6_9ASTE|nr:hypothetical protein RJ640_020370 [Escallonia rubra]